MGFRILRDEVIHLNSTPFEGDDKRLASGTEIESAILCLCLTRTACCTRSRTTDLDRQGEWEKEAINKI